MEKDKNYHKDEIELIDLINSLGKRRWLIIIPTFILVVIVGVISFILPEIWEVKSIILPSKFNIQTEQGSFEEAVFISPKQIAGKINEDSFNQLIASELNLDIRKFPDLKAEVLKDTNLIKISSKDQDVEKLKSIHLSLFKHIKSETDKNVDIEMKNIESQIKVQEIKREKIEDEIKTLKSKQIIKGKRREEIEKALIETRKRIIRLEEEQNVNLKNQNWKESQTLGMIIYSNEIQLSLLYLNDLIEGEDIKNRIGEVQSDIKQIEVEINNLKEKKGRIDYAQLSKEPTSSIRPVAPNKKLNVIIAGFLSLFIFTMLAFFLEYIKENKSIESKRK